MANKFQIVISAVDKATATVRKINASMGRLTRPITQIRESTAALGRTIGLDKVGKSIGNVARESANLAGKLTTVAAPLAAIVGGGSVAGVTALATEWARWGAEVSRTAVGLDMTTANLQRLRGASMLAGLSAQDMTGGLKSLGDTLEDALYGRNQDAMAMLNRLGVGIHHTADGSINAARGLKDLANAIAGIKNVQAQGLVARTFGIEALLPLLRKGAAGIEEYERKVAELGGVRSQAAIAAAEQFGLRLNYLSIATQGVKDAIGERLIPILQPLLDRFTQWVVVNRELIATKVGEFVEGLAHWVEQLDFNRITADIASFGKKVGEVVDWMGGWKNAAIGLVLVLNAGLIANVINLGFAIGKLATVAIPAAIRGFALLASVTEATLVPAVVKGLMSIGSNISGLAMIAASRFPMIGGLLATVANGFFGLAGAIAATPVGWLIAGAVAVAASVYAIYKNWDDITDFFKKKWEGVKTAFDKSWTGGIVKALWEFNPVKLLADTMNGLSKWLFDFDLYDAGKNIVASLIRGIKNVASLLPTSLQKKLGLDDWLSAPEAVPAIPQERPAAAVRPPAAAAKTPVAQSWARPPATPSLPGASFTPPQPGYQAASTIPQPGSTNASRREPLGIRQNNPGNLRSWGDMPVMNGFAAFPTPEAGISAMVKNLQSYQNKYGINTVEGIVRRWAPPNENKTGAYIDSVSKQTGFNPRERLNLNDPQVMAPLVSAIIKQENGRQPYDPATITALVTEQIARMNGGSQQQQMLAQSQSQPQQQQPQQQAPMPIEITVHAPAGTKVSARTTGGDPAPVRVSYSMPTMVTA